MSKQTTIQRRNDGDTLTADIVQRLIEKNDVAELTTEQRNAYYRWRCERLGVDPAAMPFEYLELDGRMVLYPRAALADQLRELRGITCRIVSKGFEGDLYVVTVIAIDKDHREHENVGVVSVVEPARIKEWSGPKGNRTFRWIDNPRAGQMLPPDMIANCMKRAVSQAMRRATFGLCGLGGESREDIADVPEHDLETAASWTKVKQSGLLTVSPAKVAGKVWIDDRDEWPNDRSDVEATLVACEVMGTKGRPSYLKLTVGDAKGPQTCLYIDSLDPLDDLLGLVGRPFRFTVTPTAKGTMRVLCASVLQNDQQPAGGGA